MSGPLTRSDNPDGFIPNLVFVIMSFDEKMLPAYTVIKNECNFLGLQVKRADEIAGSGLVTNEVREYLVQAEFIICDLTGERHNVYYELGLAQGLGNDPLDIFLVAKVGTTLHFNIAPFRVRYYRSPIHLRKLIETDFKSMVIERRNKERRI
jgi:hypothetical protein